MKKKINRFYRTDRDIMDNISESFSKGWRPTPLRFIFTIIGEFLWSIPFTMKVFLRYRMGAGTFGFFVVIASSIWAWGALTGFAFTSPMYELAANKEMFLEAFRQGFYSSAYDYLISTGVNEDTARVARFKEYLGFTPLVLGLLHWFARAKDTGIERGESLFLGFLERKGVKEETILGYLDPALAMVVGLLFFTLDNITGWYFVVGAAGLWYEESYLVRQKERATGRQKAALAWQQALRGEKPGAGTGGDDGEAMFVGFVDKTEQQEYLRKKSKR